MLSPTPITQRDVAHACGVHPSTICLALKNSPSIPEETRRRVQLMAQELGYQLNAAARNLALLRTEKKTSGSLPIAWINQENRRDHWRVDPPARVYFQAAQLRAGELGYHLEEIWTKEPGMNAARVAQIAGARGIEGVVFPVHRSFDFSLISPAWKEFSMVGLNDHRLAEWVDVVCPDHHRNAEMILRQIDRLDCTRVGLVLSARFNAASRGLMHGCFQSYQGELAPANRIPAYFQAEGLQPDCAGFDAWLREYQPEVVVCGDAALVSYARSAGFSALWIGLDGAALSFDGGIDDAAGEVAVAAIDYVVEKMRRFEKGLRETTCMHLLKGGWVEPRVAELEPRAVVA